MNDDDLRFESPKPREGSRARSILDIDAFGDVTADSITSNKPEKPT